MPPAGHLVDIDQVAGFIGAFASWLEMAKIDHGPVFRNIDQWGNIAKTALDPQAINAIVKQRADLARFDSVQFSAHGL